MKEKSRINLSIYIYDHVSIWDFSIKRALQFSRRVFLSLTCTTSHSDPEKRENWEKKGTVLSAHTSRFAFRRKSGEFDWQEYDVSKRRNTLTSRPLLNRPNRWRRSNGHVSAIGFPAFSSMYLSPSLSVSQLSLRLISREWRSSRKLPYTSARSVVCHSTRWISRREVQMVLKIANFKFPNEFGINFL